MTDNSGSVMLKNYRKLTLTEYEKQVRMANGLSCHSRLSQDMHERSQIEGQEPTAKASEIVEFTIPNLGDVSDDKLHGITGQQLNTWDTPLNV